MNPPVLIRTRPGICLTAFIGASCLAEMSRAATAVTTVPLDRNDVQTSISRFAFVSGIDLGGFIIARKRDVVTSPKIRAVYSYANDAFFPNGSVLITPQRDALDSNNYIQLHLPVKRVPFVSNPTYFEFNQVSADNAPDAVNRPDLTGNDSRYLLSLDNENGSTLGFSDAKGSFAAAIKASALVLTALCGAGMLFQRKRIGA